MADKIGNPLEQAASSGMLGQKRSLTSTGVTQERQFPSQDTTTTKGQEPQRVKRTLMFTRERAKWLKIQAAQEEREMSEIIEEALATYQKMHA